MGGAPSAKGPPRGLPGAVQGLSARGLRPQPPLEPLYTSTDIQHSRILPCLQGTDGVSAPMHHTIRFSDDEEWCVPYLVQHTLRQRAQNGLTGPVSVSTALKSALLAFATSEKAAEEAPETDWPV